jgi:iron complex transport system permease protein
LNNRPDSRTLCFFLVLSIGILVGTIASACLGAVNLSPAQLCTILFDEKGADPVLRSILLDFRLPRISTALLAGAALGAAGLIMQTIFRNPLADPFILGVNSGASLGVAFVVLIAAPVGGGLAATLGGGGQIATVTAASLGAGATLFLVLALSRRVDVLSVLIIGLMISYAIGAIVSLLMFFSMAERLQSFINWSFGDYGGVSWQRLSIFAPAIGIGLLTTRLLAKPLDALLLGDHYAASIGTEVKQVRFLLLAAASLLAGAVTGFCGPIGFLGIAAPHLARTLLRTSRHAILLPASLLTGALLSLLADLTARAPGLDFSLPLNALTALIGAPVIIAVLMRQRNRRRLFE